MCQTLNVTLNAPGEGKEKSTKSKQQTECSGQAMRPWLCFNVSSKMSKNSEET